MSCRCGAAKAVMLAPLPKWKQTAFCGPDIGLRKNKKRLSFGEKSRHFKLKKNSNEAREDSCEWAQLKGSGVLAYNLKATCSCLIDFANWIVKDSAACWFQLSHAVHNSIWWKVCFLNFFHLFFLPWCISVPFSCSCCLRYYADLIAPYTTSCWFKRTFLHHVGT